LRIPAETNEEVNEEFDFPDKSRLVWDGLAPAPRQTLHAPQRQARADDLVGRHLLRADRLSPPADKIGVVAGDSDFEVEQAKAGRSTCSALCGVAEYGLRPAGRLWR